MIKKKIKKKEKKKTKKSAKRIKQKKYVIEDGVTQGLIMAWQACRMRAKFMIDGWESGGPTKSSMAFGTLFHWLLHELYDAIRTGNNPDRKNQEEIAQFFEERAKKWLDEKSAELSSGGAVQDTEFQLTQAGALFQPYCDYWPEDFKKSLWVELEGVFDINHRDIRRRGRTDGVMKAKSLCLLETKTKSRIEEGIITDALAFDFQNLFYLESKEAQLGKSINKVLYNIVRRPGLKLGVKETLKDHGQRIREDVDKRPDHYFKRFEVVYPATVRECFAEELAMKLGEFKKWVAGDLPTYKCEGSCTGKWTCEYLGACASGSMAGYTKTRKMFRELD